MFKGLRTKIESEQKGQGNIRSLETRLNPHDQNQVFANDEKTQLCQKEAGQSDFQKTGEKQAPSHHHDVKSDNANFISEEASHKASIEDGATKATDKLGQTMEDLRQEIITLKDQLSTTIKEREESNDQNAQLYQLIEKLRRNLESEREINASHQLKLNEANSAIQENKDLINSLKIKPNSISMQPLRSLSPGGSRNSDSKPVGSVDALQSKIDELESKLSEKNRQLKVRQQNLIDIRKALQKELSDHNRTKDELTKLQQQVQSASDEVATLHNGSNPSDTDQKNPPQSCSNDRYQEAAHSTSSYDRNDEKKNNSVIASQLDAMSCLSMSSASVDDFDSNDLQQNSCNKGVNLEYLKNVLYSYMTSTDTETTQHLVKAISVMMNFTPEQSAAVKSALSVRSSWLRLK